MLELIAGKLKVTLDPALGGAIASFKWGDLALLKPVADPRLAAQLGCALAGYPLVPFANRVAWGRFEFAGERHHLALNFGDHPHTIHGNGWMRSWRVEEDDGSRAKLVLEHAPPPYGRDPASEWPFAYRAEQVLALEEHALVVGLRVMNTDIRAWPAGIGLHPYLMRTPRTTLEFNADTVWTNDKDALPADEIGVEGALEFDAPKAIGADLVDNCFSGWDGRVTVHWPEYGIGMRISAKAPLDHLQVYTPVGEAFCGIEPVSNMPDAINRMDETPDQGMVVLQPGETLSGTVRFEILVE